MADLYYRAWQKLLVRIEDYDSSWGKGDVKQAMLECLVEAGKPYAAGPIHGDGCPCEPCTAASKVVDEPLSNREAGCRCGGSRHAECEPLPGHNVGCRCADCLKMAVEPKSGQLHRRYCQCPACVDAARILRRGHI